MSVLPYMDCAFATTLRLCTFDNYLYSCYDLTTKQISKPVTQERNITFP